MASWRSQSSNPPSGLEFPGVGEREGTRDTLFERRSRWSSRMHFRRKLPALRRQMELSQNLSFDRPLCRPHSSPPVAANHALTDRSLCPGMRSVENWARKNENGDIPRFARAMRKLANESSRSGGIVSVRGALVVDRTPAQLSHITADLSNVPVCTCAAHWPWRRHPACYHVLDP